MITRKVAVAIILSIVLIFVVVNIGTIPSFSNTNTTREQKECKKQIVVTSHDSRSNEAYQKALENICQILAMDCSTLKSLAAEQGDLSPELQKIISEIQRLAKQKASIETTQGELRYKLHDSWDKEVQKLGDRIDKLSIPDLVFWSNDFHISTIADVKDIFAAVSPNIRVIDKSLSGHCSLKNTCAKDLRVLNRDNGLSLGGDVEGHRKLFFETYKNDPEMQTVDGFICTYPNAMCEIFMPFNKSLIVSAPTRYETGRWDPNAWRQWNENLKKIRNDPRNLVIANNWYDSYYMKYFTGFDEVPMFESYCGYTNADYQGTDQRILIGPSRLTVDKNTFFAPLHDLAKQHNLQHTFHPIRDLYQHYTFEQIASHVAILNVPYQLSIMSFFEYYRMNIPMFFPSKRLLTDWHVKHRVLSERCWQTVFNPSNPPRSSPLPRAPNVDIPYDPNDDLTPEAIEYWNQFADFYQWPHVIIFDSWEDLVQKVKTTNFKEVSRKMKEHNAWTKQHLIRKWRLAFHRMFPHKRTIPQDYSEGMKPYS
jgi:hypothetical protein